MNRFLFNTLLFCLLTLSIALIVRSNDVSSQEAPMDETTLDSPEEAAPEITPPQIDPQEQYKKEQLDAKDYFSTVDALKSTSHDDAIRGWEQFLEDHPDTRFKLEIRENINSHKSLLRQEQERKMAKDLKDKEDYNALKETTKTLPIAEQIAKYEEYIKNHSDSAQIDLAKKDLEALKNNQAKLVTQPIPPQAGVVAVPGSPLAPAGQTKDPGHAAFMATVPGLFVPGMGSFYAGDTTTGVVLVVVRAAGLGMIVGGAVRESNGLLITGVLAAGFSYLIDIAAAPILARDYNQKLEKKASYEVHPFVTIAKAKPYLGLSVTF